MELWTRTRVTPVGDVPAWLALSTTALAGGLGFSGSLVSARKTAQAHKEELEQELRLHRARVRIDAIDKAADDGIQYRERIASSLKQISSGLPAVIDDEALWSISRSDNEIFLGHLAALTLRFGSEKHPVCERWGLFAWKVGEAADFAGKHRPPAPGGSPADAPRQIKEVAEEIRKEARRRLNEFMRAAAEFVEYEPAEKKTTKAQGIRRIWSVVSRKTTTTSGVNGPS